MYKINLFMIRESRSTNRDMSMRHIVAGAPGLFAHRLCAGSRIGCALAASRLDAYGSWSVNETYCRRPALRA